MKPKSSIMLYLVLTLIISLGLSAVLPRFAVGYGSFEVFVETDGEMKDFVVFLQFRGTFDATKFNSNQTTEDARYFLGVESGKNGITNEALVNLVLTVSWQRPHSTLHVVFPALTVLVRDPNFNSTIWPSTETSGNLTGLNELRSRLTVWSVSGVLLYSYSNQASVSGGKLKWTYFPQEKNLTEHTLFFVDVLLAALVSSLVVIGIRGFDSRIAKTVPRVTLALSAIMFAIYGFVGTGDDFLYSHGFTDISKVYLHMLSPVFHTSFWHVFSNLFLGFVLNGWLIECWLRNMVRWRKYAWILACYVLPIAYSIVFGGLSNVPGIGASFWIIALSLVVLREARQMAWEGPQELFPLLVAGFSIVYWTYPYALNYVGFYFSEYQAAVSLGHLWFLLFAALFIFGVPWAVGGLRERLRPAKVRSAT